MLKFDLVENALDSLSESIKYYLDGKKYSENARCYKFSILMLQHSTELLLKQVLYNIHPTFIYENIDEKFNNDSKTVTYRKLLDRVIYIGKIPYSQYFEHLTKLNDVRNNIQHFKVAYDVNYLKEVIYKGFSSAEYIMNDLLNLEIDDYEEIIDNEEIEDLRKDQDTYNQRRKDIKKEFNDSSKRPLSIYYDFEKYFLIPCPKCSQKFLFENEDESVKCKFCNSKFSSKQDVFDSDEESIISSEMKREVGKRLGKIFQTVHTCPECKEDSLVFCINKDEDSSGEYQSEKWICLSCYKHYGTLYCDDCGSQMPNSDRVYHLVHNDTNIDDYKYICPECFEILNSNNDIMGIEYISYS